MSVTPRTDAIWLASYADGIIRKRDQRYLESCQLERELTAAKHEVDQTHREFDALKMQLAALKADKERLDWLEQNPIHDIGFSEDLKWLRFNGCNYATLRDAIDAARKEAE